MTEGFKLGEHQFLPSGARASLDRLSQSPRKPIFGALPPSYLVGLTAQPKVDGPGQALIDGAFCGHGEPTYSVFDVLVGKSSTLEISLLGDSEGNPTGMIIRNADSVDDWIVIHDHEWFQKSSIPAKTQKLPSSSAEPAPSADGATRFKVSIGFEYPPDCSSQNEITWIAIAAQPEGDPGAGIIFEAEIE